MNTLLVGLALAVGAPALKEAPKADPSPVGEWTVEESLLGGKPDGLMQRAPIDKIVISADRWTVVRKGQASGGVPIGLDPKANPPRLDFFSDGPASAGFKGVYRLDGDTLTVCYVLDGHRPAKVESPPGSRVQLLRLKRIKN